MKRKCKIELVNNILFALIGVATALFMAFYEYYAIGEYASTLEQEEARSFGVAMIIVFIFGYVVGAFFLAGFSACVCALAMVLNKELLRGEGNTFEGKKQWLIIIALKCVVLGFIGYMFYGDFNTAYATTLSKIFYCFVTVCCLASVALSIYSFAKTKWMKKKK